MAISRACEVCGQPIDPERVEAIPETRLCVEHARKIAQYGGEFIISASHERTSKVGSLKKNFGGVTPKKHRNDKAMRRLKDEFYGQR